MYERYYRSKSDGSYIHGHINIKKQVVKLSDGREFTPVNLTAFYKPIDKIRFYVGISKKKNEEDLRRALIWHMEN